MKKYIPGQIRAFDRSKAEETRTVQFVISSSDKDRHRSVVNMDNWNLENFNANPIVGYQHNVYGGNMCTPDDPDDVIGSGRAWVEETNGRKELIGEVTFEPADVNPKAEKIFRKVLNGTLRATSVGFLEMGKGELKKQTDNQGNVIDQTYYFAGQELIEFSIVNIPSNPKALGRSLDVQEDWALQYLQRFMPETMSIAQLKNMRVAEVFEMIKGKIEVKETETGEDKSTHSRRLRELKLKQIKQTNYGN